MRRARRGQTLALFALTLLVLTLMVALTLGIATKAKEKMELQQVTDAAAYSQAVTVARSLNGVAVLNRAEVSVMVTLAATQSLISWTSVYMASLNALKTSITETKDQRCDPPAAGCSGACAKLETVSAAITAEYDLVFAQNYQTAGQSDGSAGQEALAIQGAASAIWELQQRIYNSMLGTLPGETSMEYPGLIRNQALTRAIVARAKQGAGYPDEYEVDAAGDVISLRELKVDHNSMFGNTASAVPFFAVNPRNDSREISVQAAMGTRGNAFVRNRTHGGPLQTRLQSQLGLDPGAGDVVTVTNAGMGYWTHQPASSHAPPGPAPYATFADDEGTVGGSIGTSTCQLSLVSSAIQARVIGDDRTESRDDDHSWTGGADGENAQQPDHPHTMGDCTRCPGVWTMFLDLNPDIVGDRADHLHGQPKTMAIVRRNLLKRCGDAEYEGPCAGVDPWNLMFRFRFGPGGELFDGRGLVLTSGDDISAPVSLATGLAYYHRPGHWREPPNFFNPFWRATLVSTAVDRQGDPARGGRDLQTLLDAAGGPSKDTAKAVIQQLDSAGFRGWQ